FGYYEIGSRFNTRISAMIHSSLTPIFPATAEIFETHGIEKVELLRVKSLKYIFGISTFLYGTVFIAAPGFVALWLGGDMKVVSRVIQILSVGSYVVSLNIPAYTILNGLGYAQDTLKIEVQRSIVHAISIVALVWVFGFFGFCAAFTVSIFYNYYITNHYYKKRVGHTIRLFEYLSNWKADIAIASLLVIAYVFVHFFGLASYFSCAVFSLGLAGSYGLLTWQLHFFTIEDFKEIAGPALSRKIFSWLKNAKCLNGLCPMISKSSWF